MKHYPYGIAIGFWVGLSLALLINHRENTSVDFYENVIKISHEVCASVESTPDSFDSNGEIKCKNGVSIHVDYDKYESNN